jgi:hypothetical protein
MAVQIDLKYGILPQQLAAVWPIPPLFQQG